ncbi:MAG: peptidase MA family metallohydrolase, partial [Endomicrobiales bacterium]
MVRSFFIPFSGRWILAFLLAGAALFPPSLFALSQNKVTTKDRDWKVSSTRRFDVYHYGAEGERLFPFAARYLEQAYDRAAAALPAAPKERFSFFLYNEHNDFEETNITPVGEGTGGVTEAFKERVLAGHTGSQRFLEYVIAHEVVHEVEYEYLFSGFWRSARLLKFIVYPHWLMEGLAEYVSGDLDRTTREMYVRDAATSGSLLPLEHLNCFTHLLPCQVPLAYKESEALIRYIADEYGAGKLPLLLASYRERYYPDSVLRDVLGTGFFTLDRKFREYLEDTYAQRSRGLEEPAAYGERLTVPGAFPRFHESAVFSPGGGR